MTTETSSGGFATETRVDSQDASTRACDGVICMGGSDWWYHNRGHYDMQIMRQMCTRMPVLYVNSIGMRTPSPGEGRMFVSRVRRKLRSMRRGLVHVSDGLSVYSPLLVPSKLGIALGGRRVGRALRAAAARQGITRPLVWVACPTAAGLLDTLDPAAVVYQRTDRYECFRGVDVDRTAAENPVRFHQELARSPGGEDRSAGSITNR